MKHKTQHQSKPLSNMTGKTGPISRAGKKISAQNARKSSIFVQGYLPWEDLQQKQLLHEELCKQWQANDPTRLILLSTIEQSHLELERIMFAQRQKVEGAMQSLNIAKKFCQRARLDFFDEDRVPSWYFHGIDEYEKEHSFFLLKISEQVNHLHNHFHESKINSIGQDYPDLAKYIQEANPQKLFLEIVEDLYQKGSAKDNLFELVRSFDGHYRNHLNWAKNAKRYQTIIDGIRGELMLEAMDPDKTMRYTTTIQNRILKGIQGLVSLRQLDTANGALGLEAKSPVGVEVVDMNDRLNDMKEEAT
jgi:hypothetical protein